MEVVNPTPFAAAPAAVMDLDGADYLVVVLKATFALDGQGGMAPVEEEAQRPVELADRFTGEPGASSVAYASDLALHKANTDVVLTGDAYPPAPGAREGEVGVRVGPVQSVARVFGDRRWGAALGSLWMSRPEPFERIPLVYEWAFGGTDDSGGGTDALEPRNPVGVGFRAKKSERPVDGQPLPNVEDPRALISAPDDRPAPAGFGFVGPGWQPRAAYAGTYDDAWTATRSPLLPTDFDPRFFDVAPPALVVPGRLRGDEMGAAVGVSPHGPLRFTLPGLHPSAEVAGRTMGRAPVALGLDRVVVDAATGPRGEVVLVWSGGLRVPRGFHDVDTITLALT